MSNYLRDGQSIRFTSGDPALDPLQRAVAGTAQVMQGDPNAPHYLAYDARVASAWVDPTPSLLDARKRENSP